MKPKIEIKSVKHVFTGDETAQLNVDFRQAFANLKAVESEFDNVKAIWKSKTTEAESRMETLNATLQAGFEMRQEKCVVVLHPKESKKFYFLAADIELLDVEPLEYPRTLAVISEAMTDADFQQELIEAESKFEAVEEIELFSAGDDAGFLKVGRLDGKWFSALNVKIGTRGITERLDSEQACCKKRPDTVKRTLKRFTEWLDENLGREEAKGFKNAIELIKAEHAERAE